MGVIKYRRTVGGQGAPPKGRRYLFSEPCKYEKSGCLLVGAQESAGPDGTVQVAAAAERIVKHFQVTGLARLFGKHATVEAALAITARAN